MAGISFDIFWRDHGARRGARETGDEFQRTGERAEKMKDGVKAGALGAALAVAVFGKKAIETASDVAESTSKIGVVFGTSAQSVLKFGETSATSLGISKQSALDAAGTFGNLFVALKLPQSEAAKMSTRMITLAADMASFNNATPEEALEALRAGLVGETEPLRAFGVNMDDATLRTKAMSMGLIKNTKESLAPAIKAQAAYAVILEQTGTAQGDFARTSDGLANQQRILKARFSDLQAELGAELLPAVNSVMGGLLDLLGVIEDNSDIIVPLVGTVAGLAAVIWTVNKAIAVTATTQAVWTATMVKWNAMSALTITNMIRMASVARGVGAAFSVVAVGMAAVWAGDKVGQWQAGTVAVEDLAKGMKQVSGQSKLSSSEMELFSRKLGAFGGDVKTSDEALKRFGTSAYNALDQGWDARIGRWQSMGTAESKFRKQTEQLDAAFAAMVQDGNIAGAQKQVELYEKAAEEAGVPVASLRKMFPQYTKAVADSKPPMEALTVATKEHTKAAKQDYDAIIKLSKAILAARGGENAYEAALDDATAALKDNGATLDKHTAKGRTNRAALDAIASATHDWRDAAKEAGESQKKQTKITEDGRAELVRMARRFGLTKKEAKEYAREVLGIPKKVSSRIDLSLKNNIPKTLFGIKVGGYGQGLGVLKAAGGPVWGAGTETSDSIPAMLSNNEHVLTAREVRAFGGHGAVERMRKEAVQGFAEGGSVFGGPRLTQALVTITGGTTERLAKAIEETAAKAIGYNPSLNGAVNFARRQVGKPYIWGGVGPRGYDCSGAMSALLNVVQGLSPYHRRFATGSFPSAGFVPGPGSFMIGSVRGNPGHMAGTINGINVESSGSRGFGMGKGVRGARDRMFSGLYHLKGYRGGGRVSGDAPFDFLSPYGDEYVGNVLREAILSRMPAKIMDSGGWIPTGRSVVDNRTGAPENLVRAQSGFSGLRQVVDRGISTTSSVAGGGSVLTAQQISDGMVSALSRGGLQVVLDGQIVGRIQGRQADLLGRAN
jgi:hypothetical protein